MPLRHRSQNTPHLPNARGNFAPITLPQKTVIANRYRVERELGRGGVATVYSAWDIALKRWVAVKVSALERFGTISADEARLQASCQHPHIMPLYDAGNDLLLQCAFLVMPLYPGGDLAQMLNRYGQMPFTPALRCIDQLCEALIFLQQRRNALHGDIKPANIWLTESGSALLMDFNVYGLLVRGSAVRVGTLGYTAPEAQTGNADTRSDIFALGCVLYECLTGHAAFADDQAACAGDCIPIQRLRPEIYPELAAVIHRALHPDAAQRYQTLREFQSDLRKPFAFRATQSLPAFLASSLSLSLKASYRNFSFICRRIGYRFFRHFVRHPVQAIIEAVLLVLVGKWLLGMFPRAAYAHSRLLIAAAIGVGAIWLRRYYIQWKTRKKFSSS